MKLHELIAALEEDDSLQDNISEVYILPPQNEGAETDEDSDASDDEHTGNVNHFSKGILDNKCEFRITNDDDYDKEDLLPLSRLQNVTNNSSTNENGKRHKKNHWSNNIPIFSINKECTPKPPSAVALECENPMDFFQLFFDQDLLTHIVDQTNVYGQQKNNTLNFTIEELFVIIGALLLSGYAKYPNKRMFWNGTNDTPIILKNSMRLNRFENLIRHMHFNDNSNISGADKLYKLRPIIEKLNNNFRFHGALEESISVDESMIPYYGKHYAKQYIKGKPIRFGFKNWALCTSSGYLVAFEVYTGKSNAEKKFGLGGDTVLSLLQKSGIKPKAGYKIYFDNYFTSVRLLEHLSDMNICATGTIRENRTERCKFLTPKEWKQKDRGSYEFMANDHVMLVQWKDNKVVTVGTNFEDNSVTSTKRWCKEGKTQKNIPQPKVISSYNKGMGGVDKMDGHIAAYRSRIRQRKWYWPIFAYLLDTSVVNAWLLMKKIKPTDPNCVSLLAFRRYLAVSLLEKYGTKPSRGKNSLPKLVGPRFDNVGHIVQYSSTDRRCQVCKKKSNFICIKCDCGLHPKLCFENYHKK